MTTEHGGPQERPQEHAPEVAGSRPAPAPSRTRPDSPRGKPGGPGRVANTARLPAQDQRPPISEAQHQAQVIALAQLCGWTVAHFRPARTKDGEWRTPVAADGAGFPDLVLVRDRVLFVELKADKGALAPAQVTWRTTLLAAGAEHRVWRPKDWNEIENELGRPRGRRP